MTQRKTYRIAQVNRLLQEEIAELFLTGMEDDRMRYLTVTEVRTSKDLSHAVVFVTTRGGENREECLAAANQAAGYIRKTIYPKLKLKRVPAFEFRYDESLDRAERIFRALEDARPEMEDGGTDPAAP